MRVRYDNLSSESVAAQCPARVLNGDMNVEEKDELQVVQGCEQGKIDASAINMTS